MKNGEHLRMTARCVWMVGTAQERLCPPYGNCSGNVFADLGFANPEEELLKAKLIREIRSIIKRRKLTQAKAAILLGLKQPDVSSIITGRVGKFSLDRLVRCLDRLDYKVDVVVRHKPRRASRAIAA